MSELTDHPLRRPMITELHARPFSPLHTPVDVIQISMMAPADEAARRARSTGLLSAFVGKPTEPEGPVFAAEVDGVRLKWERHTEFESITLFIPGETDLFATPTLDLLPPSLRALDFDDTIVATRVAVLPGTGPDSMIAQMINDLTPHFMRESLAVSWVAGNEAMVMGDFHLDDEGFTRFAVLADAKIGQRRLGRVVQRVVEVEVYRAMAMLALPVARKLGRELTEISGSLTGIVGEIGQAETVEKERDLLARLTDCSARLTAASSSTGYRFSAAGAYEALVNERIEALREDRVAGRQTLREFMTRRFNPAMRTCAATERRMERLSARAERAANLLRTRVDVSLQAQNQEVLASMNERAELQLRLQETVEGFSVVAISYYAVSLVGYLLYPFSEPTGISTGTLKAIFALPVLIAVFFFVRGVKKRLTKASDRAEPRGED
ncbi:MAG: DUF3422 domain-containing protein [Pseudomonadota bacterium]